MTKNRQKGKFPCANCGTPTNEVDGIRAKVKTGSGLKLTIYACKPECFQPGLEKALAADETKGAS